MRKIVVYAVVISSFASTIAVAHPNKLEKNPHWGNSRIIFGAQYPAHQEKAVQDGLDAGGTLESAIESCYRQLEHFEDSYGKGACERVRELRSEHHNESTLYHGAWHIVIPGIVYGLAAIGGLVAVRWLIKNMPQISAQDKELSKMV